MNMSSEWGPPTPEELEIMGKVEYYNYRCRSCNYEEEINESAVYLGISNKSSILVCPNCEGRFEIDEGQNPPEGR